MITCTIFGKSSELLTISIAMKIWGKLFGGQKVLVYCDNEASVKVLNSGFTKDEFMQCYSGKTV
jgi:hypothetical protein